MDGLPLELGVGRNLMGLTFLFSEFSLVVRQHEQCRLEFLVSNPESPPHPLCSNKCANIVNEQNIFPSHYLIPTMPTQHQGLEK